MGSLSIWHWLMVLIFWIVGLGWPMWRIVRKTGHPPALSLLIFVPVVNLALLWFLAFSKWRATE